MRNNNFTVCGIIEIDGKVLLVRHTYGSAKDRILCPGGYVNENELPTQAIEREILEETGVVAKADALISMQFKSNQWCAVFTLEYVSGTPKSDNYENNEVLLLSAEDAIQRSDITNMSRELLTMYLERKDGGLHKRDYLPKSATIDDYVLYGK
ncbi:MAG: NUDIX hydrolase [Clostridia bacterium]|nr:NUDIX hydrolase [Clostridia bacterium]